MVHLRPASPAQLARFSEFERDKAASPFVNSYTPKKHADMAARDDVTYLAIEKDNELDGFVLLVLDPDQESVELRRIVVATRDQGTGRIALAETERYCRHQLDRQRIWLDVAWYNARARHLYKELGFTYFDPPQRPDPEAEYMQKRIV